MVSQGVALAQVPLRGKGELEQQAFGSLVGDIDDRLNAMQPKFGTSVGQNGRHGFGHEALSPTSAVEVIACFGTMKAWAEVMETARTEDLVFILERDTPADGLAPGIACLCLFR